MIDPTNIASLGDPELAPAVHNTLTMMTQLYGRVLESQAKYIRFLEMQLKQLQVQLANANAQKNVVGMASSQRSEQAAVQGRSDAQGS